MIRRYRQSEPAFDRRVQAHNDARRNLIIEVMLKLLILTALVWLLLRTVREAGGWLAIF